LALAQNIRNMPEKLFKYKGLSLTPDGCLDDRSISQVIEPIVESYYYLPTRAKLNDPNEGVFQNQLQAGITSYLRGVTAIGERIEITRAFYGLAQQISQSSDNSGVFSLSSNVIDELMWTHYGASHCGIAVEYSLNQLTRFSSPQHLHYFRVKYVEEPPSLSMSDLQRDAGETVINMLGHKSPRWRHEEEYRVVLENMNGQISHDYRAVKSITFGLKVPDDVRQEIYTAVKHKVPVFYEICKIPDTYILERMILEDYLGETPTGKLSEIDWNIHFENLGETEKERFIILARSEIEQDPHFNELYLADRSPNYPSKVVLQYEVKHHRGLQPWTKYTKHYYEL
jgi:hypothetical protein